MSEHDATLEASVCGCNDPDQHQTAKPIQSGDVLMMLDSHMRFTTLDAGRRDE